MRTRPWWGRRVAISVAVCALLVTGCGGGSDPEPDQTTASDQAAGAEGGTPEQTETEVGDGAEEDGSDPEGGALAAGDLCGTLEEFYQLSVLALFGLALDPSPEVVDATLRSAEVAAEVRELAPPDVARDLEPMLVLAEDLAAAMQGVDPNDPAAVTAAAEGVPDYLNQDAEMAAGVDAYTQQSCGFTADSVAEEMLSGDAETAAAGGDVGSAGSEAAAMVIPADCELLDTDRIATALGSEVIEVEQLGGNPEFTYQLGEEQFEGASTACSVDLEGGGHSPPEVRIRFVTLGEEFYPRYRDLARSEDGFAPAAVTGADGFYYQQTSFQAALVVDLSAGHALEVSASAGVSNPAPDRTAMTALGEVALGAIG